MSGPGLELFADGYDRKAQEILDSRADPDPARPTTPPRMQFHRARDQRRAGP